MEQKKDEVSQAVKNFIKSKFGTDAKETPKVEKETQKVEITKEHIQNFINSKKK